MTFQPSRRPQRDARLRIRFSRAPTPAPQAGPETAAIQSKTTPSLRASVVLNFFYLARMGIRPGKLGGWFMTFSSKKIGIIALLGLVALGAFATATPAEARSRITLRVCNRTNDPVLVASSYIPVGGSDWRNKGWTRVRAGGCDDIFTTDNRTFYARAE